jgi:alpha-D-xyloside xylohydrolase
VSTEPHDYFSPQWPRAIRGWQDYTGSPEGGLAMTLTDALGYALPLSAALVDGGVHITIGEAGTRPAELLTQPPSVIPGQVRADGDWVWLEGAGLALRVGRDPFLSLWRLAGTDRRLVWGTGPLTQGSSPDDATERGFGYAVDGPSWFHIPLAPDEACYGLGERFGSLNHRGQRITLWADDAFGLPSSESYIGVPFLMSTAGWAIMLPTTAPTRWDVGQAHGGSLQVMVAESWLEFYVTTGSLTDCLAFLQRATGPAAPVPAWSYGVWMSRWGYRTQDELIGVARTMRERQLPVDVIHLDPFWLTLNNGHTCPWEWDPAAFPDPEAMYRELRSLGFRLSLWVNPFVPRGSAVYEEARARGYLIGHSDGTVARVPRFDDDSAVVDFTNPAAAAWYQGLVERELTRGAAVVKTDFGESVPFERVRFYNGADGRVGRNLNGLLYQAAAYQGSRAVYGDEAMVWGRSGYLGSQRYPLQWGGDSGVTYAYMATALRGALSYALSGAIFTAFDGGGFEGTPTPDLYVRWAAMSLLFSHTRFHGTTPREPWEFGEEAEQAWRTLADLRYQLLPYLWQESRRALRDHLPLARPMVLIDPADPQTHTLDDQYGLGRDLLVAPLFNPEGSRRVYLPAGLWYDWYQPQSKPLAGGRWISLEHVPWDRLGLFVRQGAVIPLYRSGLQSVPEDRRPADRFRVFPAPEAAPSEADGLQWEASAGRWQFRAARPLTLEWPAAEPMTLRAGATATRDHRP